MNFLCLILEVVCHIVLSTKSHSTCCLGGSFHHNQDGNLFLLKIALKNGRKWNPIEGSLWRKQLHTCDLKSAKLPNVIENNIRINKTLPITMGSIAKMNFEKNLNWKFEVENLNWKLNLGLKIEILESMKKKIKWKKN